MSDYSIKLIPNNHLHIPNLDARERARALLRSFLPDAEFVVARVNDAVKIVDAGGNSGRILCPVCKAPPDLSGWWIEAVDKSFATSRFQDLNAVTPCCNHAISLNEMRFEWPMGFASFELEARNQNEADLGLDHVRALEEALGCSLRKVLWRL